MEQPIQALPFRRMVKIMCQQLPAALLWEHKLAKNRTRLPEKLLWEQKGPKFFFGSWEKLLVGGGAARRPYDSPFGHCVANPGYDKGFELELDKNISELLK